MSGVSKMSAEKGAAIKGLVSYNVVCIASWNADLISHISRPLLRGETALGTHFSISPGGKGSNAAIACARQGAAVAVVACIGDDDFGHMALDLWRREGIDSIGVTVVNGQMSGVAQILVYEDGDNSIAVTPGAGTHLSAELVRKTASTLRTGKVVMASCEVPVSASLEAFRLARVAGVITLLNPAPAMPLPGELLVLCDVITPNENELLALAGLTGKPDANLDDAAQKLLSRGVKAVAVTLGEKGCTLYREGQPILHLAGHQVQVADTIGAGDTFTGALAAALARGLALPEALQWANAAAALSVTGKGAIGAMPTLNEVNDFLAPNTK
jgi:ribokinase